MLDSWRFAVGTLTAIPVRMPRGADRDVSGPAMVLAPLAVVPLGLLVTLVCLAGRELGLAPLGSLSGGEQQRLRVAQALVGDPAVLLCDEPLLSLDLANQRVVSSLVDRRRREHDTAVLFVTHEINPILDVVDRVLYLVEGRFRIGTPEQVMTSEVLSDLYGTPVEVLHVRDRLVVVGTGDAMDALGSPHQGHHHHGASR